MVKDNLNIMHVAKQEFLHCDSNEKKLALKINIQRILIETLKNGDEVSYEINDSKVRPRFGMVIEHDGNEHKFLENSKQIEMQERKRNRDRERKR